MVKITIVLAFNAQVATVVERIGNQVDFGLQHNMIHLAGGGCIDALLKSSGVIGGAIAHGSELLGMETRTNEGAAECYIIKHPLKRILKLENNPSALNTAIAKLAASFKQQGAILRQCNIRIITISIAVIFLGNLYNRPTIIFKYI